MRAVQGSNLPMVALVLALVLSACAHSLPSVESTKPAAVTETRVISTVTEPRTNFKMPLTYDSCAMVEGGLIRAKLLWFYVKIAAITVYRCNPATLAEDVIDMKLFYSLGVSKSMMRNEIGKIIKKTRNSHEIMNADHQQKVDMLLQMVNKDSLGAEDTTVLVNKGGTLSLFLNDQLLGSLQKISPSALTEFMDCVKVDNYEKTL
jgi:hypothetical protein